MPGRRIREAALVGIVLAGVVGGFWVHRVYLQDPAYAVMRGQDVVRHAYPTAVYIHNELRSGNLPIWNPYQMAGQPFLALHVTAVLYPPNLLFMGLLLPGRALEALALFHFFIAGFMLGGRAAPRDVSEAGLLCGRSARIASPHGHDTDAPRPEAGRGGCRLPGAWNLQPLCGGKLRLPDVRHREPDPR